MGKVANPIPTVCTGEESDTEQGTVVRAAQPSPAANHSRVPALSTAQSLHPQIVMGNPKPRGTKSLAGPLFQFQGRGNKQCHLHFHLSSSLISKIN